MTLWHVVKAAYVNFSKTICVFPAVTVVFLVYFSCPCIKNPIFMLKKGYIFSSIFLEKRLFSHLKSTKRG